MRGRDIKRYGYEWANLWLIYIPWHFPFQFDETIQGASDEAEQAFKEQYPTVYLHLLQFKDPLSNRNKAETGIRYEWYALQRWGAKYWEDFFKPKIIWGEISDKSKFAFDFYGSFTPEATTFYMKGTDIEFLLCALNSSISEWMFSKVGTTTGVGTVRWKKYTIEQLLVGKPSAQMMNKYMTSFEKLKKQQISTEEFEMFCDEFMFELYGLTEEEISFIQKQ